MARYALGLDYGTSSVRSLLVDVASGAEVATAIYAYLSGNAGVLYSDDPNLARQNAADYIEGFHATVREVLASSGIRGDQVIGIGVDTTGSTPIPVDSVGMPLSMNPKFADNLAAYAWLWKDHTGFAEAAEITEKAKRYPYLAKCGGTYSSEWFWSKILHCARTEPEVFEAAHRWVELADWLPAYLTGNGADPVVGICGAGHKAMYSDSWGGLPSAEFLATLDPRLALLRDRLYKKAVTSDHLAGHLLGEVAARCGLAPGTPVAVGAFDAHFGAVGAGIKPGTIVKIIGTSTCDCLVHPLTERLEDVPGLCGIVPGSVLPDAFGLEAGQSAVGDLFGWFADFSGKTHEELTEGALRLAPAESGLLALDWNNGNRTVLVDPLLTGLLVGQTLHTTPAEVYRALIEATAFGALKIIDRLQEYGVPVSEVVVCGGIADKSPLAMQIYADVFNRPILVSDSAQTCALGSAIFGAVAGGAYATVALAQAAMAAGASRVYQPSPAAVPVYAALYELYAGVHDAFGLPGSRDLSGLMKRLLALRQSARAGLA